jgi:addiction module RelE/StbE family toxin
MNILYKPSFLRDFKKLPKDIQEEAFEKIELFKSTENHDKLKVHKLKGRLSSYYSFSVNYSHRIVFTYEDRQTIVFLGIGDHDIYK